MDSFLRESLENSADLRVWRAIQAIRDYSLQHAPDNVSDFSWWGSFEQFYLGLADEFTGHDREALEIATDALLVRAGMQSWSLAKAALAVSRAQVLAHE